MTIETNGSLVTENGTRFAEGSFPNVYYGVPTPEEKKEIECGLSTAEWAAVVTRRVVGNLAGGMTEGFEVSTFDL